MESSPGSSAATSCQTSEQQSAALLKERTKANDAILVAVGIVAVLVANVAFVGYLTPPGGADPYWADCYYPIFIAFTYFNGFALVFAVAAIFAVTIGPAVLTWQTPKKTQERGSWRDKTVRVGLLHLGLSLLSFIGAFACAGFVTALVQPPLASCAIIKCDEGGVPCDASPPFRYNSLTYTRWLLDTQLVALNRDLFPDNTSKVYCANYNRLSTCHGDDYKDSSTLPVMYNWQNNELFSACDVCLVPDEFDRGNVPLHPHNWTTWCAQTDTIGQPVELTWYQLKLIAQLWFTQMRCGHGWNDTSHQGSTPVFATSAAANSAWAHMIQILEAQDLYTINCTSFNPDKNCGPLPSCYSQFNTTFSAELWPILSRVKLLPTEGDCGVKEVGNVLGNFWEYDIQDLYNITLNWHDVFGFVPISTYKPLTKISSYAFTLGANGGVRPATCKKVKDGQSTHWTCTADDVPGVNSIGTAANALGGAVNYGTMRYVCSGKDRPVLCDKGSPFDPLDPPLAVDLEGAYLTRKELAKYSGQDIAISQTTNQIQAGVIAMLVVALIANLITIVWLAFADQLVSMACTFAAWLTSLRLHHVKDSL